MRGVTDENGIAYVLQGHRAVTHHIREHILGLPSTSSSIFWATLKIGHRFTARSVTCAPGPLAGDASSRC